MKLLITFVLSVLLNMGVQAMAQETEYQFGVRWSVNGLASSIDVQDIMLDFSGTSSNRDTLLPISQYIKNGKNTVKLYTWPLEYESDHELRVSLLYWEPGDNPNTDAKTAFEVVMMPGQDNAEPEVISIEPEAPLQPRQNGIRFNRNEDNDTLEVAFNNRQQMPTWCWEEGDVLKDNDATRDSLTREYRRLHALFAAGDNDALLAAASTRTKELALASGTPEDYVRHRFSYTMYFDNPDIYQLNDFPEEPMTLNLGADNRVAWLTTEGVQVPIRFNHIQENDVSSRVRPYFIRRDGQWEICR
ncbi:MULTISPECIES: hypothetical protein [unclassified Halomonas]|uniref:hypothetical protein n=1 Tax=unclassified Halomonas TaxID=2609666 RepID=UPI0006DB3D8E|nr:MULTISPECIES: hypothetical protein [unclassified Halomonas]KPQ19139.1 MAG: hypothetical protein HLUCCO06_01935 [Halomonas sp. HL-93]SBR47477.1 hypothetical protein GA0071314_1224 [Halomonas sp. HL-93]SNY99232.1 hypothetical protein SAMN04488142_3874 [Halomonas sp. hl-4]